MDDPWLIAVHGGAGYHSTKPSSEKAVKLALRTACTSALLTLRKDKLEDTNVNAVERAVCSLENNESLNAGTGSNLTLDGHVECDASIMNGETHAFGSAGAVQGVKNPITLARAIMQNARKPQPLGRVPPLTLVSSGAHAFASSSGLQLVDPEELITNNARRGWEKWKTKFEDCGSEVANESIFDPVVIKPVSRLDEDSSLFEDTVGAIACAKDGKMAAGVSSGGLLLKYPGRIGEAAVFGAGVWAHSPPGTATGVACSVSGTGEDIVRTAFARSLAEALHAVPPEEVHEIIQSKLKSFCDDNDKYGGDPPSVGAIIVMKEPVEADSNTSSDTDIDIDIDSDVNENTGKNRITEGNPSSEPISVSATETNKDEIERIRTKLRLWCAFTTQSMAVAYASSEDERPQSFILRRESKTEGRIYIIALSLSR